MRFYISNNILSSPEKKTRRSSGVQGIWNIHARNKRSAWSDNILFSIIIRCDADMSGGNNLGIAVARRDNENLATFSANWNLTLDESTKHVVSQILLWSDFIINPSGTSAFVRRRISQRQTKRSVKTRERNRGEKEKCFIAIENKIKEQLRFMLEISMFDLCDGSRGCRGWNWVKVYPFFRAKLHLALVICF